MSVRMRRDEEWYREWCAKSDRFKVGTDQRRDNSGTSPPVASPSGPGFVAAPEPAITATYKFKYRNKPTNGYASIKESKRAFQLKLMQEAGQIRNLREQVEYLLIPKQEGERACSYVADFVYEEWGTHDPTNVNPYRWWEPVVEDCKGMRTDIYKIKRKLMLFVHKIRIRET